MAITEDVPVRATKKSFDIVEHLMKTGGGDVSEIADEFGMATSTAHDHLTTLHDLGYVVKERGHYHLSLRFLDVGERVRNRMELYKTARPELQELAEMTGEHASLVVEEHGRGVLVETIRGSKAVKIDTHNGMRIRLHTTAPAKAILANLPAERIEKIVDEFGLPAMTENTITDRDELFEELEQIRQQGYALDREERIQGMQSVAAPIMDRNENVRGAISVYGPSNRMDNDRFEEDIPDMLLRSANIIELNMNYQ